MKQTEAFIQTVWSFYDQNARTLPWRQASQAGTYDPYKILVSEIMLQQTQVGRVIPKYEAFLQRFPDMTTLAQSSLADVLIAWQGLGYNRRAKYLHQTAQIASEQFSGHLPKQLPDIVHLPGIGENTAKAVLVYSYNQPHVFIETNIRSVYLYHFFKNISGVHDKQILEIVEETIDKENPREWYWALMDYGSYLKKTVGNQNVRSKQYKKQSPFVGSKRAIRGQILRSLASAPYSSDALQKQILDSRLEETLAQLLKEGLIVNKNHIYKLAE